MQHIVHRAYPHLQTCIVCLVACVHVSVLLRAAYRLWQASRLRTLHLMQRLLKTCSEQLLASVRQVSDASAGLACTCNLWLNIHPAAETAAVVFAIGTAAVASASSLNTTTLPASRQQPAVGAVYPPAFSASEGLLVFHKKVCPQTSSRTNIHNSYITQNQPL